MQLLSLSKVALITLGCAKNSVDSSYMQGQIEAKGGTIVADASEADVIIVNTAVLSKRPSKNRSRPFSRRRS